MGHLHEFLDAPRRASLDTDPDHAPHSCARAERVIAECAAGAAKYLAGDASDSAATARTLRHIGSLECAVRNLGAELANYAPQVTRGLEQYSCWLDRGRVPAMLGYRWDSRKLQATAVECWVGGHEISALLSDDTLHDLAQEAAERHIDDLLAEPLDPGYDERCQYRALKRSDACADVARASA